MNKNSLEVYSQILSKVPVTVEYSDKAVTAFFDISNKKITIPTFKYMDDTVTQLMVSHESGHACYSTYSIKEYSIYSERYGDVFNLVEDARIENIIKKEFPGLVKIFGDGYKTLYDKNFFGVDKEKLETLNLVSRLNLYSKASSFLDIPSLRSEAFLFSRLKTVKTKKEVIDLCEQIINFLHDESKSHQENNDHASCIEKSKESTHDFIKESLERNIHEFCAKKSDERSRNSKEIVYLSSERSFKNIVSCGEFLNIMRQVKPSSDAKRTAGLIKSLASSMNSFFQRKRKSLENRNMKTFSCGRINSKKLYSYRTSGNIFEKKSICTESTNHGVVILIDCSGSVYQYMKDTVIQACTVAEFCKMNDIPFAILGFGMVFFDIKYKHYVTMIANSEL